MSTRYLVIDGHSVIFAWHDLRKLHDENRAAARKALADRLQHLHDTSDWRITADQTADSIIERLVGASGMAQDILVVTADEAERLTVESLGASTASPDWLRKELEMEGSTFTGQMERIHRSARWNS
jgi:predicted RNA-binding protein with PIN domain